MQDAIIRFYNAAGAIVGTGFLVDDRHVMTCAHVVNSAQGRTRNTRQSAPEPVQVDFPFQDGAPGEAQVVRWFFKPPDHKTDIALLELQQPPPVPRYVALEAAPREQWGEAGSALGFPTGYADGVWVEGVFRREQAGDLLQLDASTTTQFFVEEGFSGAPVWDAQGRCTGMIVAVAHLRTAFLIPAHRLAGIVQRQAQAPSPAQAMSSLFPQATQLILPHVTTPAEREMWLSQAFYATDRRLYDQLAASVSGAPVLFTTNLLKTLWDVECFPDGQHALSVFLNALCLACDDATRSDIHALRDDLDTLCGTAAPAPTPPPAPSAPSHDTLTIETPPDARIPTVFVSYAHANAAFAQRLIDDLNAAGHACWIDTMEIKGGTKWTRAISEGINNSYAFLSVVSEAGNNSDWVQKEFLWAEQKHKRIFPVMAEDCELPIYMIHLQATAFYTDYRDGVQRLLAALPAPPDEPVLDAAAAKRPASQRALELEYLDFLRFEELVNTEKYTPLAGTAHVHQRRTVRPDGVAPVVIRPEFEHLHRTDADMRESETRTFEDIIGAIHDIRRAVVLGEPGAGKTTTLWKLARNLVDAALDDPAAPVPVLVRLGDWKDAKQPLAAFIAEKLGGLGAHLDTLLANERAVLLLDGLNEIPVAQRDDKARQVQRLFEAHPDLTAVVTCREQDYTRDLGFDRILITPLDPLRIREFVTRYLGAEQGEALFWRLAGGENVRRTWETWRKAGASFALFWTADDIPRQNPNVYGETSGAEDSIWRDAVHGERSQRSMLNLARNPYMLLMMTDVFARDGDLPDNRGELFARFVATLLRREDITDEGPALLAGLARLAYEMQVQRSEAEDGSAVTVLDRSAAREIVTERQLYLANSTSILSVDEDSARFTHQLLQEYFAAVYMRDEIEAGRLHAGSIWPPEQWWQRTNWEEAAILLAGLYSDDCTPVVEWVAAANPEVAALCVARSGAHTPSETLERFRAAWIPRLTDLDGDSQPHARAAVGQALGLLDLDDRPGVGLRDDGLPDLDWVEIPEGEFIFGDESEDNGPVTLTLPTFYIARYPVTYKQFQAFIDAPDGFHNPEWWEGLAAGDDHKAAPGEQRFKYWNHPRENVSWWDAIAFYRWLSSKLGYEVTLPTEQQFEKAARGTDGRTYPWGDDYIPGYANIDETWQEEGPYYIRQTTAVGMYPQGASPYGVLDLSGNVWCWCLNEYDNPENTGLGGDAARVLRGGSWLLLRNFARSVYRSYGRPVDRDFIDGFWCVCASPMT